MVVDGAVTGSCLGTDAMAAYGFATPVATVFAACASVCEIGASMLVGRLVGAGKTKEASKALSSCLAFAAAFSLLLTALTFFFSRQIADLLGAESEIALMAADYLRGFSLCAPALLILTVLMPVMQIDGERRLLILSIVVMTAVNITGDLLVGLVFKGGLLGMSLATTVSYFVALFVMLIHFFKKKGSLKISFAHLRPAYAGEMIFGGLPNALQQVCRSLLILLLNNLLLRFDDSDAVAAFTAIMSAANLCMVVGSGIGSSTSMLTGIFVGEKDDVSSEEVNLPYEVRASLMKKIVPMPERAKELREIFKNGSNFRFVKAVWPHMDFVFGVGGDGFSVYANTIRQFYADESVKFIFSGITASEGLWSVPVEFQSEDSCLVPGSAFMEFLPVEAGDDFSQCVSIDRLEPGRTYELIITNLCGFYRYRMSDAVMVTGFYNKTPRVRFMYRVNKTINLAAEKTTEKALQVAVEKTAEELGFILSDFVVYPDAISTPPRYVFLIQPPFPVDSISEDNLAETVNRHLCVENEVYDECLKDYSMQKAAAYWLQPESTFLWREVQVAKGRPASQLKPLRVIANEDQRKFFFILRENP